MVCSYSPPLPYGAMTCVIRRLRRNGISSGTGRMVVAEPNECPKSIEMSCPLSDDPAMGVSDAGAQAGVSRTPQPPATLAHRGRTHVLR